MARILVLLAIFGLASAQATTAAPICNEAMCRSPAIEMTLGAKQAYDCWATGSSEPMACATGYEAKEVPSVPRFGEFKYYTCCKPGAVAAGLRHLLRGAPCCAEPHLKGAKPVDAHATAARRPDILLGFPRLCQEQLRSRSYSWILHEYDRSRCQTGQRGV